MAGISGFALGGAASSFQQGMRDNSMADYRTKELQLQEQGQQNAMKRDQFARIDKLQSDLWSHIGEYVEQAKIANPNASGADIAKHVQDVVDQSDQMSVKLGLPKMGAARLATLIAAPSKTQTAAAMTKAKDVFGQGAAEAEKTRAETESLQEGTQFTREMLGGGSQASAQPQSNMAAADSAMHLNPQEQALYQRHLTNLSGPGGVDNPDGSRSSLFQISVGIGGKFYNIPTVWDGKKLSPDQAVARAKQEGIDKFPSYRTEQEAESRYQQMHHFMERDTASYLQSRSGSIPGAGMTLDPNDPGDQILAKAPESMRQRIKDIAEYRVNPTTLSARAMGKSGVSLRDAVMSKVEQYAAAKGEPYDQNRYMVNKVLESAEPQALAATLKEQTKNREAVETFSDTAIANGEVLLKLAKKVDKTGIPVIERWTRAGRAAVAGDADVTDFNFQLSLWQSEMARIIVNPRLVGQLTDNAREELQKAMQPGANYQQIEHAVNLAKADAGRRKTSYDSSIARLREQLKSSTGVNPKSPSKSGGSDTSSGTSGEWKIERVQ